MDSGRMIKINMKIFLRLVITIWIGLWCLFLIRPYFKKDLIGEYRVLLSRSLEGKRSFVMGDELYAFMVSCRNSIPEERFTYSFAGLEDDQLAQCRMAHWLYPAVLTKDAEYIFVFKKPGYREDGYKTFRTFGEDRAVLRKAI